MATLCTFANFHVRFLICTTILMYFQIAYSLSKPGNETDRLQLLEFKAKIGNDPYGILSSWNDSINFCKWYGVTCGSHNHQRVTSLSLQGLSLSGSISPSIGNLTFLRLLNLSDNQLHGQIPQELGRLFRLKHVNLSSNALAGGIPITICNCSEQESLDLSNNRLVGNIPHELGSLKKLVSLRIFKNNLTGEIPHSFGNLSSLQIFSVGYNKFVGNIPDEFGKSTSLQFFGISVNNLTGRMPSNIYNISSMKVLSVSFNQLNDSLPPNIGLFLPNLQIFFHGSNHFHGTIPTSLANASNLEKVDIAENFFTGLVPTNFGNLIKLETINLGRNYLGNKSTDDLGFIESLSNCSNLRKLVFNSNNFGGVLPSTIVNMSSLVYVALGTNQISGKIPDDIGNLVNLYGLGMEENHFSGSIPVSLGKNPKLQVLELYTNQLSGEIPDSLGNISQLFSLALFNNKLEGNIPSSIGNCRYLSVLVLDENKLSGTIPEQIIGMSSISSSLNLSRNSFIGPIPLEVGKLINIAKLDLSDNKLSGKIPRTVGDCQSMETLNLQGNFLHGLIPSSLASLRGLQHLDLSRNKLSGKILKEFEKLLFLKYLNLSFNNLSGEVPKGGVFRNLSAISLTGNDNLCGGIPELHLPPCPVKKSKHRSIIAIVLAPTLSLIALSAIITFLYIFYCKKSRRKSPTSTSFHFDSLPQISYKELLHATGGFSSDNLIGQGGFGSVYRGNLDWKGKRLFAVKVFNLQQREATKSFIAECEVLKNLRHRNLVKVLTYCSSIDFKGNDFKALVFDFMSNGSLETWLHPGGNDDNDQPRRLNLLQRLEIAIDVASALHYLHDDCEIPIIHCDLKPSNILLDDDMTAHIGDFGLARLWKDTAITSSEDQTISIGMKGTIGYMAPEYGVGNAATTFGDTYSFGIILLEMFTGKRPTDDMFAYGSNLHNFVKTKLPENLTEVVDPILFATGDIGTSTKSKDGNDQKEIQECKITVEDLKLGGSAQKCIVAVLEIGVSCSAELAEDRMNMRDAVRQLNVTKEAFLRERNRKDKRSRN